MPLLLKNARLVDGSGGPTRPADVWVEGDTVRAVDAPGRIAPQPDGAEIVEAEGKYLMPGFIDVHSHSDYHLCVDPAAPGKVMQGVTAEIGGNCGYSPAPVEGTLFEDRRREYREIYGIDCRWHSMDGYLDHLRSLGLPIHYAQLIGHNTVRASVMQGRADAPTAEELESMKRLVRRAMREGAIGLSMGLIYAPGCFSSKEELIALCRVAAEEGGLLTTHMRSEGKGLVEAVEEVTDVARQARIPLQISHLKTSGPRNWPKLDHVFRLIEEAKAEGLEVDIDRYPYTASYTGLASVLPNACLEGTRAEQTRRLRDPEVRRRALEEIGADHPEPDYFERVRICQVFKARNKPLEGLSLERMAQARGQSVIDAVCDLLVDEEMMATAIYFTMSETNLRRILGKPYCMVGSDAAVRRTDGPLAEGKSHPRAYGTFPRYLKMVRDEGLLPLEAAVHRMTDLAARKFRLSGRGRIAPGMKADLVLLDLDALDDRATYEDPHRYPTGIAGVWVDGQRVLEDGAPTGRQPGRVLAR